MFEGSRITPFTRTVLSGSSRLNEEVGAIRVGVDFRRDSLDVEATCENRGLDEMLKYSLWAGVDFERFDDDASPYSSSDLREVELIGIVVKEVSKGSKCYFLTRFVYFRLILGSLGSLVTFLRLVYVRLGLGIKSGLL